MKSLILVFSLVASSTAFAHGGEDHDAPTSEASEEKGSKERALKPEVVQAINMGYLAEVKPIFKTKCLDCHGKGGKKPWYYAIPGPKQLIDHDIEEAQEHMDMSKDFPFGGHGDPKKDLEELAEVLEDGDMPPLKYRIMHWDTALTAAEKKTIEKWINRSLETIKNNKGGE